MTWDWTRGS